jgi:uncharacterized protein YcaQ
VYCRRRSGPCRRRPRKTRSAALLRLSARALGVATEFDLRDYYRLGVADTKARIAESGRGGRPLAGDGRGLESAGLSRPCRTPRRRIDARALLAPFDPLVWERERTHRIFDFFYRIEIYTPLAKRTYGYYVLPFLLGDRLVGRVDLKADRANSRLLAARRVHSRRASTRRTARPALDEELRLMADWLGLETVTKGKGRAR